MKVAAFAVLACLTATQVHAQACYDMGSHNQRKDRIAKIWETLKESLDQIEVPSPDTAAYIESEKQAALEQYLKSRNAARYNILTSNPSYYPVEFQKKYTSIKKNVEGSLATDRVGDEVIYLSNVLDLSEDLKAALIAYYAFDEQRTPRVVTQGQAQGGKLMLSVLRNDVLRALQCGVRQMREPEKP